MDMSEYERFMVDDGGTLIDIHTRDMYDVVEEVVDILNGQYKEIQLLEEDVERQKGLLNTCITQANWLNEELEKSQNETKELEQKLKSLEYLLTVELIPELIFLTGLKDFKGEKIDFSDLIKKIEMELKRE